MEEPNSSSEWLPVSQAATRFGIPTRTVYRWIRTNALPSRKQGKGLAVEVAAVQHMVEVRNRASSVPALAGNLPANGKVAGHMAHADGEIAARVFALLDEGIAPGEIVRRERLPPQAVLDIHRQWQTLRDLGSEAKKLPVDARLRELSSAVEERFKNLVEFAVELEARHKSLCGRVEQLEQLVAVLPRAYCPSCKAALSHVGQLCHGCAQAHQSVVPVSIR